MVCDSNVVVCALAVVRRLAGRPVGAARGAGAGRRLRRPFLRGTSAAGRAARPSSHLAPARRLGTRLAARLGGRSRLFIRAPRLLGEGKPFQQTPVAALL